MPSDLQDWQTASVQPAVHLATWSIPANSTPRQTILVPAGTHGLAFMATDRTPYLFVQSVQLHTSQEWVWVSQQGAGSALDGRMVLAPVVLDPSFDGQLDVFVANTNGTTALTVDVFAVLDVERFITTNGDPQLVQIVAAPTLTVQGAQAGPLGVGYYSNMRSAWFTQPTKSGAVNQATGAAGADLQLFDLGTDPVIYALDLVMVNTATTGGSWATVRMHDKTRAADLYLAVLFADKSGSGFPYRISRSWIFDPPLDPGASTGFALDDWAIYVNAGTAGTYWGGAILYA